MQIVNTEFEVFDKSTHLPVPPFDVTGPVAIHTLFASLGGLCGSADGGDPIVLYDRIAGRWFVSQLEYTASFATNLICIAVSDTSDATGSYHLYAYNFGNTLPDYPKFGVWPDGYYMSDNAFTNGVSFVGAQACAFDRNAMVTGQPSPTAFCFQGGTGLYNLLPADLDGTALPPSGAPNAFLQFVSSGGTGDALRLYKLHPDFNNIDNSTFTGPTTLSVATYREACGGGACVPQAGATRQLDSLGDRLMYRLQYRKFPTYESLVVNHSVRVSSSSNQTGCAGMRSAIRTDRPWLPRKVPTRVSIVIIAGWEASPRTSSGTWRWDTASRVPS